EDRQRHRFGELVGAPLPILRLRRGDGTIQDFTVLGDARTWYVPIHGLEHSWEAELGYIGRSGRFVSVLRSNRLELTPSSPVPHPAPAATAATAPAETASFEEPGAPSAPSPVSRETEAAPADDPG